MDSKSFWLVGCLVDTGKSDYNIRVTCFNCFDTPFMYEPACVRWLIDHFHFWKFKNTLNLLQTLRSLGRVMKMFPQGNQC
jgi:hypothetical protein